MGTQTLRLPRDAERTRSARRNRAVTVPKMMRMRNQDQIRNLRRWAWTTGFVFLLGSCWDCFPDCWLSQKMSSMPIKNMSKRFPTMYVFFTEEHTRATDDLGFIDGIEASCWCPNQSTLFIRERRRRKRVRKAVERKVAGRRRKERRRKPRRSERNACKRRSKSSRRKRSVRRRSSRRNYLEKAKRPFR